MDMLQTGFLSGVIEGFYGQPWTLPERLTLFPQMRTWGLNTYLYAPKDDLKHRALWRESYSPGEIVALREIIAGCQAANLRFFYAIAPGLDIRYSQESELETLRSRIRQMLSLGCRDFALLFDDIPDRMDPSDRARFGSFANAQCQVVNALFEWTRAQVPETRFLFCPTPYCGRMAQRGLGGDGYLATLGHGLDSRIGVLWTGPEIVSATITVEHVKEMRDLLRRKPVLWDNLHANDYDGRRMYLGPYAGRPPEIRSLLDGILVNSNNELPLNFVSFRTLAAFLKSGPTWDPRHSFLQALEEWLPRFSTASSRMPIDDLILLADCYYLPYEEGTSAVSLFQGIAALVGASSLEAHPGATTIRSQIIRLRDICARMAEIEDRPLFHAMGRRIWELREELDLLDRYLAAKTTDPSVRFTSDFHQPGTYRGGMVPKLQKLLIQGSDGTLGSGKGSE